MTRKELNKQHSLWHMGQTEMFSRMPSSRVLSMLTIYFLLSTANPLAQNQHLSHASQTFLLPVRITSVDTDSPQPLLLALKTSLAFISPNLNLLVLLGFSQRQQQQLSDEITVECGKMAPWRGLGQQPCNVPSQLHDADWAEESNYSFYMTYTYTCL